MILAIFVVEFLVKGIRIRSFCREQLNPLGFFKLVTHEKGIVLCLYLFNVTPVQEGETLQLLTPTKCTVAYIPELRRDDNFLQCHTIQKTSLPTSVSRGGSHMLFKATQWQMWKKGGL